MRGEARGVRGEGRGLPACTALDPTSPEFGQSTMESTAWRGSSEPAAGEVGLRTSLCLWSRRREWGLIPGPPRPMGQSSCPGPGAHSFSTATSQAGPGLPAGDPRLQRQRSPGHAQGSGQPVPRGLGRQSLMGGSAQPGLVFSPSLSKVF